MEHAGRRAPVLQQRVTRRARPALQVGAGGGIVPDEHVVRDAAAGEPAPDLGGFGARFGAQIHQRHLEHTLRRRPQVGLMLVEMG